jgi:hypothetical protein
MLPLGEGLNLFGCAVHDYYSDVQRTQQGDIEENIREVLVYNNACIHGDNERLLAELRNVLKNPAQVCELHGSSVDDLVLSGLKPAFQVPALAATCLSRSILTGKWVTGHGGGSVRIADQCARPAGGFPFVVAAGHDYARAGLYAAQGAQRLRRHLWTAAQVVGVMRAATGLGGPPRTGSRTAPGMQDMHDAMLILPLRRNLRLPSPGLGLVVCVRIPEDFRERK